MTAVVLAAGAASRFGGGKLLAPIEGRPVLQHVLDRLAEAGVHDVVVVLGDDAAAVEKAIEWRTERRIRNEDPGHGLSSSLRLGIEAVAADVDGALIVLGDQPFVPIEAIRAVLSSAPDGSRPIVVPVYDRDSGRNPVLVGRGAFALATALEGDRGLGPVIESRPELVRVAIAAGVANPDLDTRADHVALLQRAWADRVRANNAQVDRHREVPDGTDFYAPVTSLFRADPARTDEPALAALLSHVRPGETWIDIGAGAGRYALPIARALAPSDGRVIAVDPSVGMLAGLKEIAAEHGIDNVRVVEVRWPADDVEPYSADVALIAHVGYDIAAIGPFLEAMERAARRLCIAVLMESPPASAADSFWPPVWGERRVQLPALPAFHELLVALGRRPSLETVPRETRRFGSRDELEGFLRRQLWTQPGSAADERLRAAVGDRIEADDAGRVGLVDQAPSSIGIVAWEPPH